MKYNDDNIQIICGYYLEIGVIELLVVGADVGKFKTKVKWKGGIEHHLSKIATFREIKDNIQLDDQYLVIEYDNIKYLAGTLAEREGQNFLNSPDINKSNLVTLLNLLISLSKLPSERFSVVLGNPFGVNYKSERESIKNLIIGIKKCKINGQTKIINIERVGIAPEGLAAYYTFPHYEDVNILDFGSSTIHAIAIRKRKLLDKRSHTFDFGFETMIDTNYDGLIHSIKIQMEKKWNDNVRKIILIGGMAPEMFRYVKHYYPEYDISLHANYEFANANGLYELGVIAYGGQNDRLANKS